VGFPGGQIRAGGAIRKIGLTSSGFDPFSRSWMVASFGTVGFV
jgi:hypothetical protein